MLIKLSKQIGNSFAKIMQRWIQKRRFKNSLYLQKPASYMFDKALNMPLNWLPKLRMFHF